MIEVYGLYNSEFDSFKLFEMDNKRHFIGTYDGYRLVSKKYKLTDLSEFDYVQFKSGGTFKRMIPIRIKENVSNKLRKWFELSVVERHKQVILF